MVQHLDSIQGPSWRVSPTQDVSPWLLEGGWKRLQTLEFRCVVLFRHQGRRLAVSGLGWGSLLLSDTSVAFSVSCTVTNRPPSRLRLQTSSSCPPSNAKFSQASPCRSFTFEPHPSQFRGPCPSSNVCYGTIHSTRACCWTSISTHGGGLGGGEKGATGGSPHDNGALPRTYRDASSEISQVTDSMRQHCVPFKLASGGVLQLSPDNTIILTADTLFTPPCTAIQQVEVEGEETGGVSSVADIRDPFHASVRAFSCTATGFTNASSRSPLRRTRPVRRPLSRGCS